MTLVAEDVAIRRLAAVAAPLAEVAGGARIWLVGGVVRDALLDRELPDVDLVTDAPPDRLARGIAAALGGSPFPLSDRHGCWRVAAPPDADAAWRQIDVCAVRGSIEEDLRLRDFTINAIAYPLGGTELVDPLDGRDDLVAGMLRLASDRALDDDPLRLIRAARFAHLLGLDIDEATRAAIAARAARAAEPSGERTFAELCQLVEADESRRALRLLDSLHLLDVLLPELAACRGLEQSRYHHLDVFEHTLAVLDNVEDIAAEHGHYLPADEPRLVPDVPFDTEQVRVLRFAALAHDLGKPATHRFVDGKVSFVGHDEVGVGIVHELCRRWATSNAFRDAVALLVRTHLALGKLLHAPLDARAQYRFLRATSPQSANAVVLSLADRFATGGVDDRRRWRRRHTEAARTLWNAHWREVRDGLPEPLLDGLQIADAAGIEPGPRLGALVDALAEAQAVGDVTTPDQARDFVRAAVHSR